MWSSKKKNQCCPTGVPAHRQLSVVWQHRGCIPAVGAVVTLGAVLSVCFTVSLIEHNGHRCFSSLYYSSAFLHSWFITGLYLHLHSYFTLIINWYWLKQLWSLRGRNVLLYTFEYCFNCPNHICIVLSAYFLWPLYLYLIAQRDPYMFKMKLNSQFSLHLIKTERILIKLTQKGGWRSQPKWTKKVKQAGPTTQWSPDPVLPH